MKFLLLALLALAVPASAQTNECAQTWTFDGNWHTLRNGEDVGGIGHSTTPYYRCVNAMDIYVVGQDGATWFKFLGGNSWALYGPDPGGVQFLGTLTPPEPIVVGAPFKITWDHYQGCMSSTGGTISQCTTGYHIYVDDVKLPADVPASAWVDGVVTSGDMTLGTVGNHTINVSAFNSDGETKSPSPLIVTVGPPPALAAPAMPTGVRVQ